MTRNTIVFTAAGSGGHIFAALATLKSFKEKYPILAENVVFVGSTLTMEGEKRQLPMEERLCARMNVPFLKIRMGKVQRQFSLNTLKLLAKIFLGFIDAWRLIRKLRPKVIAAFGGYVAFPMVIVGKLYGAKIVLHEQTSSIGLTNKLLQWFADYIGITFDTSAKYFRRKTTVVGSPTMHHIYAIETYDQLEAYLNKEHSKLLDDKLYLDKLEWIKKQKGNRKIILMSGGSQGSHFLNEHFKEILPQLLAKYVVVMQVGENEWYNDFQVISDYLATLPSDLSQYCVIRKFIYEEYGYLMRTADLFVARSGANTVYQAGMNGVYALFVPIPWVTKNEQYTNAVILRDKGRATIIDQDECTPSVLLNAIDENLAQKHVTDNTVVFPSDADSIVAAAIGKLAV